ncbi:CAP domain-containing protein [uncultured Roseobacter sp.]|uniref:CAP domain-containing protein n=1 Tax=uncultured Roseobacter sp. TaxID=114847 RepID=UPI0026182A47|nr:CAP domain-containing protein [uncultured Roseobacter sp.]
MIRLISAFFALVLVAAACAPVQTAPTLGSDGKPLPSLYRIKERDTAKLQFRMLDAVNALRGASAQPVVEMDAALNAAAATHSRDMSIQNRPWHFGSDGSSPIDRIRRVGYQGTLVGETISETYESELETLAAWMEKPDTQRILLSPEATDMGFAWFQESNGKIWWTLVMGRDGTALTPQPAAF